MTTTPTKTSKPNDAPVPSKVKVDERKLQNHLFNEFLPLIKLSAQDCDQDELQLKMHRALKMFADIDPQDGCESMLVRQMIGIHHAQHECLQKALLPNQHFEAKLMYLDQAVKLSNVYIKQMQALDKHRGHASQKVTVEHVTVESGGQAFVGNMEQQKKAS